MKRHGCPSHRDWINAHDEKEVWLCDAFNQRMHIFDNTIMPPKQLQVSNCETNLDGLRSVDGKLYPSTGEIIDVKTRKIIATLKIDEKGNPVMSEKVVEIHIDGSKPVKPAISLGSAGFQKRNRNTCSCYLLASIKFEAIL